MIYNFNLLVLVHRKSMLAPRFPRNTGDGEQNRPSAFTRNWNIIFHQQLFLHTKYVACRTIFLRFYFLLSKFPFSSWKLFLLNNFVCFKIFMCQKGNKKFFIVWETKGECPFKPSVLAFSRSWRRRESEGKNGHLPFRINSENFIRCSKKSRNLLLFFAFPCIVIFVTESNRRSQIRFYGLFSRR